MAIQIEKPSLRHTKVAKNLAMVQRPRNF